MSPQREVLTIGEARDRLNRITEQFSEKGASAEPIVYGSHRKAEGVIVGIELWELIEDTVDIAQAQNILATNDGTWLTEDQMIAKLEQNR